MFSAAQYNLSNSSNNLSVNCLERLFQRLVSITPESSLNFSLLRKFQPYFPHRAMWMCCPSLLLEEYVSQPTCCLSFLRTTLAPEAEMSFHCFSLHFTCRARGQRCIPFWVTHTPTELSTEGRVPRTNSPLAWIYTKQLTLFPSDNGPALAQLDQRGCAISALGGFSGSIWTKSCTTHSDLRAYHGGSRRLD